MPTTLRAMVVATATACTLFVSTGCGITGGDIANALLPVEEPTIDPAAPFAGSPSEKFGNGADAIVIPKAKAVGRYTAKDVAYAYTLTKKILTAAYLDRVTLLDGKPDTFKKLLDPNQRKNFLRDLDSKDPEKNTRGWVASFSPGTAELVGDVIKVQGKLSAAPGKDENGEPELHVKFDYRFVYAVRKPGTDKITRVMYYDRAKVSFWRNAPREPLKHWIEGSDESWSAGVECTDDGFLHPSYPGEASKGTKPSGPAEDPYAESTGSADDDGCGTVDDI
ncbi:hypothetical protein [Rhizohabitans arisaemae]|uniref:hypothetical protein n=1 Tax=Rhizohabitans arisaemae TaxID=2720610 RepID=UPI0024B05634|nr:hypothetical protein [Rhizohabitans arisaemae]